jgi:hypothetical protein
MAPMVQGLKREGFTLWLTYKKLWKILHNPEENHRKTTGIWIG